METLNLISVFLNNQLREKIKTYFQLRSYFSSQTIFDMELYKKFFQLYKINCKYHLLQTVKVMNP